jgi:hypothetical protein
MPFDVSGAIDMHAHCGPEGIPRRFDALQMARHAQQWGLRSIVMKSHFTDTSPWAQIAYAETGMRLGGAITLNHYVGGINPMAVRAALGPRDEHGGFLKVVWMPTVHANSHICVHCAAGDKYDIPAEWAGGVLPIVARPINSIERISLLDPKVQPALQEILDLVAENDLVLGTGHVGRDEIYHLMDLAKPAGVAKVVVTHAQYNPPGLGVPDMVELANRGAYIELCWIMTDLGLIKPDQVADAIRRVGARRIILSTDVGQVDRLSPGDALTQYGELLLKEGLPLADIELAMKHTPEALLGLP